MIVSLWPKWQIIQTQWIRHDQKPTNQKQKNRIPRNIRNAHLDPKDNNDNVSITLMQILKKIVNGYFIDERRNFVVRFIYFTLDTLSWPVFDACSMFSVAVSSTFSTSLPRVRSFLVSIIKLCAPHIHGSFPTISWRSMVFIWDFKII